MPVEIPLVTSLISLQFSFIKKKQEQTKDLTSHVYIKCLFESTTGKASFVIRVY